MNTLSLVFRNLARRPARNLGLALCVAVVAGMQVSAGIIESGCRKGYELAVERLGADLVAVPDEFADSFEQAYLTGEASLFYMGREVEKKILDFEFVDHASVQLYVKSLSGASCCSAGNIFLIGFDPATDFTVRSWLRRDPGRELGKDDILVGADFHLEEGDTIRFYGHVFTVAGALEASGSGLDRTCFMTVDAAYLMAEGSKHKAIRPLELAPGQISAVMVRIKPESEGGVSTEEAAYQLMKGVYEISVIEPNKMLKRVHDNLASSLYSLRAAALALWPATAFLVGLVFAMATNERRRELGLMRAIGAGAAIVFRDVVVEALVLIGGGALLGSAAAAWIVAGFSRLIAVRLGVPFSWPPAGELVALILVVFGLGLVTGALAALIPAYRISVLYPAEALRRAE